MQEPGFHVAGAQFPEQEQLKCPRCESANTKFCYYNNYNLSQPRHFCKNCRRYWTKGGALRNIPVGGGSRKSSSAAAAQKRPSPSLSVADAAPTKRAAVVPAGGFSSLLQGTEADSGRVGEGFWATGNVAAAAWPDLAIYTPGSSFHH